MQPYQFSKTALGIVAKAESKLPDGRPKTRDMLETREYLYALNKRGYINNRKLDLLLAIADNNVELCKLIGFDQICD